MAMDIVVCLSASCLTSEYAQVSRNLLAKEVCRALAAQAVVRADVTFPAAVLSVLADRTLTLEAAMARISLDPPRSLTYRLVERYCKRVFRAVPDPVRSLGHNTRVLRAELRFERAVAKFSALDPVLSELAVLASAARIGCSWCMDFGYWEAYKLGISPEKLRAVPFWREHMELFSEVEMAVMDYAEAMTETEAAVSDELAASLLASLGEPAFVELTVMVGIENLRSRVNSALGLRSQGFADRCEAGEGSRAARPVPSRQ
jgi:AhpD family alkylhydroperoxidase